MFGSVRPQPERFGGSGGDDSPSRQLGWGHLRIEAPNGTDRLGSSAGTPPRRRSGSFPMPQGSIFLMSPNGSKLWRISFRVDGVRAEASFGAYPCRQPGRQPDCGATRRASRLGVVEIPPVRRRGGEGCRCTPAGSRFEGCGGRSISKSVLRKGTRPRPSSRPTGSAILCARPWAGGP